MHSFKTVTSPKKTLKSCMITFAVMFALAFFGLTVTVAFWLFLEIIVVASSIVCFFIVPFDWWDQPVLRCLLYTIDGSFL